MLDAGATAVTVEIKEGGITFMRIADNGIGIDKEDVRAAFLRHSTSKIRSAEDLAHISSLGFRGEALSSIAAVSQVELLTKTKEAEFGVRYKIAGGKEESLEDAGAPDGTTFLIRQLFFLQHTCQKKVFKNCYDRGKSRRRPGYKTGVVSSGSFLSFYQQRSSYTSYFRQWTFEGCHLSYIRTGDCIESD